MLAKAEAEQRERPPTTNLMEDEVFWKDQQVWLQEKGYMLRPRYHPNWVPSAQTKPGPARIHEDTICPLVGAFNSVLFFTDLCTVSSSYGRKEHVYRRHCDAQESVSGTSPL